MIHTMFCTVNGQLKQDVQRSDVRPLLADESTVLWLDLERPDERELSLLAEEFRFHPLAVEDAGKQHQRPKIDRYDGFYFLVFYDINYIPETAAIEEYELDIFLGNNYLVTVHDGPIEEIEHVAERFKRNTTEIGDEVGVLLYSLLDTIVDHYFPVIDCIGERVEELETRVFQGAGQGALEDTVGLNRELINLRRVITPERDVVASLARRELPLLSSAAGIYFQDVYDHVLRVTEAIDTQRELLNGALDSYLAISANDQATASNNLNQVVRTLTSFSIILMSLALIAGIYGMNFNPEVSRWNMPELNARYGYPGALVSMALVGGGLVMYFKRKGWL